MFVCVFFCLCVQCLFVWFYPIAIFVCVASVSWRHNLYLSVRMYEMCVYFVCVFLRSVLQVCALSSVSGFMHGYSQHILNLGHYVFSAGTLSFQCHTVPHSLRVQLGKLSLCQRQTHAALLPTQTHTCMHTHTQMSRKKQNKSICCSELWFIWVFIVPDKNNPNRLVKCK